MVHVMEVFINIVNFIRARGLNHRHKNGGHRLPYHTEVRWLNLGSELKHFFGLRGEIINFMEMKGKPVAQIQSQDWIQELIFIVDIADHLNNLNTRLYSMLAPPQICGGKSTHLLVASWILAEDFDPSLIWQENWRKILHRRVLTPHKVLGKLHSYYEAYFLTVLVGRLHYIQFNILFKFYH